ncbi:outer membrane lipoprotein chaperone LolA [Pusillimonas sp. MFBS29]|uniref:outer membrane lipoprotein chaperone LolA n=1 Tax=Pusillimonas sp. MFBS29 TaxID=2886690 RepID=UPI001D1007AB|nr:outer membrane lipoprotein chaperone LolA [Pusillimonas sp. MFBS29]MCC2595025.1 outer membrane lipoprotein chaperone LolA [Pusillimonas sp. MFBS29]
MKIKSGFKQLAATLLLALGPVVAWASQAPEQLEHFISTVKAATGEFTQQRLDQQGRPAQSGQFSFKRPGQFKWAVKKPYEQLIISDGKQVYQYDPDLAQVTERGVDQSIGASPAAILFGSGSLEETFTVSSLPSKDGYDWLRALPRAGSAGFTHVDIGFKNAMPARLELLDSFGQITRIDLSNIVSNPDLPADEFTFTPPADVDVVKMQ